MAVSNVDEGIALRNAGIAARILVMADFLPAEREALRKFGGDSVEEFTRNFGEYVSNLGSTSSAARP